MDFMRSAWDIIWEVLGWFQCCTFIDPWEEGVLVRMGKFKRTVKPGVAWHLPFTLDEITCMNVKPDSMELDEQVLTTKDRQTIILSVNLLWSIHDIRKCTIDVEDAADTLSDIALGFVHDLVEETTFAQIRTAEFRKELKRLIQRQARKFGIAVTTVKVANLAKTRCYRLIT